MSESTEELSGKALDAAVAVRVMETPLRSDGTPWPGNVLPYSSNIEAAMQVEDRIVELGLQDEYGDALIKFMSLDLRQKFDMGRGAFYGEEVFELIHASAEQRCRAALAAMEQKS